MSPVSLPEPVPAVKRVRSDDYRPTNLGLATPETDNGAFGIGGHGQNARRASSSVLENPPGTSFESLPGEAAQIGALTPVASADKENIDGSCAALERSPLFERRSASGSAALSGPTRGPTLEATAPTDDSGAVMPLRKRPRVDETPSRRPSSLASMGPAVESAISQDLCLPSPSLSPVTAMNMQSFDASFDSADDQTSDSDSTSDNLSHPQNSRLRQDGVLSVMDMPLMMDFFEAIPDKMKTYLMYQLLRRCPKQTLRVVADVVNPALKCDFLAQLPLELGLNVVKFLDVKTMCRASQVSKKWRQIINSDEKTWKAHFDAANFVLSDGELQRAIEEGWGWQHLHDYELDLRSCTTANPGVYLPLPGSPAIRALGEGEKTLTAPSTPRPLKRKAGMLKLSSRKAAKHRVPTNTQGRDVELPEGWSDLTATDSPYAAANAAALAVPYPNVGLASLRSLHLYKSLYRRHHLIEQNWMHQDKPPLHFAFHAHDRHVVTCLQFDSNKILTGSDDTNINVYDTKNGALMATLEGHEGGVWALQYHENTLVSGSTDRSVRVWDIERAQCTQIFQGHTSTVRCLQILLPTEIGKTPEGKPIVMPPEPLIITGSRDSSLRIWKLPGPDDPEYFQPASSHDSANPYFVRVLTGHSHSVRAIAAHGDTLVSGSYDCTVRVWKISTGEAVHRLQGHSYKVYSVVLDHKRNRCISGSMDNMVKIWSLDTGAMLFNLEGHSSLVGLLDLQADRLVSAAADSTLRIWDPDNGRCKAILTAHTGAITCFQHDGQKVISGSDRTLKMWDVKTGEWVRDLLTDLSGVWQVKFSDRRCVAAVQRDRLTYIEVYFTSSARNGVTMLTTTYIPGSRFWRLAR